MFLSNILYVYRCLVGPTVTRKYNLHSTFLPHALRYQAYRIESWSAHVLNVIFMLLPSTLLLMPVYIYVCYLINGYYDFDDWLSTYIINFAPAAVILMYFLRTIGRAINPMYKDFLTAYHSNTYRTDFSAYVENIRRYDFDFSYWPVTYSVEPKLSWRYTAELIQHNPFSSDVNKYLGTLNKIWTQIFAFALAHSFSMRIVFPGTSSTINNFLIKSGYPGFSGHTAWYKGREAEDLDEGRDDYIIQYDGKRSKISTADGNTLDVMYVNQNVKSRRGRILVICCEGHCSYYETGIMNVPVNCGYSAIGWNQPGFANSSGYPFPRKLRNSIDAIMKYATEVLGYSTKNIIMYGWNMGGYTATWAALNYPGVKGLILEATFDDLFLILKRSTQAKYTHIVREVIRCYVNINIGNLLMEYDGPLVIVRHTLDDINCLEAGRLDTNRSNSLAVRVVTKRYPEFSKVEYISTMIRHAAKEEKLRKAIQKEQKVPEIKKCLSLISKFMRDFRAPHNILIPKALFEELMNEIFEQAMANDDKKGAKQSPVMIVFACWSFYLLMSELEGRTNLIEKFTPVVISTACF